MLMMVIGGTTSSVVQLHCSVGVYPKITLRGSNEFMVLSASEKSPRR